LSMVLWLPKGLPANPPVRKPSLLNLLTLPYLAYPDEGWPVRAPSTMNFRPDDDSSAFSALGR
jgi:hypothetical protein